MSKLKKQWPRVVACLPAFNAAKFITQALEALEAQEYPNLEVLISDDASTDDTALICQSFAENSRTFRLIRQSHRLGWVNNVNALLAAAHAEYILITPHDDIIRPTYVTRLVQALEDNPHAVLAFSNMKITFLNGDTPAREPLTSEYRELDDIREKLERAKRAARYQLTCVTAWPNTLTVAYRGMFRSSAARRIGGMRKNLSGEFGADWAWLLRLALLGEFIRIPAVLVEKCRRPGSLSNSWKYTLIQRFGEWAGCIMAVRRAGLSWLEELEVQWRLVEAACLTSLALLELQSRRMISRLGKLCGARM